MSDEDYTKPEASTETDAVSEHTTDPQDNLTSEPQDTTPTKWEMPKPVFQQTSGYLPQGYLKQIEVEARTGTGKLIEETSAFTEPIEETNAAPQAAPAATPRIEPQPAPSERIVMEDLAADPPAAAPEKSNSVRISVIILGVLGILTFLTVLLLTIWFLFLAERGAGNNF